MYRLHLEKHAASELSEGLRHRHFVSSKRFERTRSEVFLTKMRLLHWAVIISAIFITLVAKDKVAEFLLITSGIFIFVVARDEVALFLRGAVIISAITGIFVVSVISDILVAIDKVAEFLRGGSSDKKILAGQLSPSLRGGSSEKKIHARQLNDYVYELFKPSGPPSIEIVLCHGFQLEGSKKAYINTWVSRNGSEVWLKWIVDVFPEARIVTISYDASAARTHDQGITDMYVTRENILQCLVEGEAKVGQDGCPVVLVGHCLGGLVLKQLCVQANSICNLSTNQPVKNLLNSIRGLIFYASPHYGSKLIDSRERGPKGRLFEDLSILNTEGARRNEEFRKLRNKYGWKAYGIAEGIAVTLGGFRGLVVEEASVRYDVDSFYTVRADHFDVCRPESTTCCSFLTLLEFVRDILKEDKARQGPKIGLPEEVIGLDERVKEMYEIIRTKPRVGIVGMAGIGKTTLALAIYKSISRHYDYCCFVADVQKKWKLCEDLRSIITSDMYHRGRQVDKFFDWNDLQGTSVLIMLDDVDSDSHIDVMSDGFANTSCLIVTSRDQRFLMQANFECHFAEKLDDEDSRRLFCLHAFRTAEAPSGHKHRVSQFIKRCDGLPLALRVAGRYLYNRKQGELWDDALKKLRKAQPLNGSKKDGLWSILEVSYDSLAGTEQEMFLDIAICFHGQELESTKRAWRLSGWASADCGWDNLLDKGLVMTYRRGNEKFIRMHEMLRDLGGQRAGGSRVRIDVSNRPEFCRFDQASREVKVLKIVCCPPTSESWYGTQVIWGFSESKICWLEVARSEINIADLDGLQEQLKAFSHLEFKYCYSLCTLPKSFGRLTTLSHLRLEDCGLQTFPESFGGLKALCSLEFVNCHSLQTLPKSFRHLTTLSHLELVNCKRLVRSGQHKVTSDVIPKLGSRSQFPSPESSGPRAALSCQEYVNCNYEPKMHVSEGRLSREGVLTVPDTFEEIGHLGTFRKQVFCHRGSLHTLSFPSKNAEN